MGTVTSEEKVTIDFSNPPLSYSYDENGIFTQTETCSPDPLESEIKGEAVWLIPANATLIEPPAAVEKHVRVFNNGAWAQVEDNRGVKYWLQGDTWQMEPREMKDLGSLPDGATFERPEPTEEEKFMLLRGMRNGRIMMTDYLLMPDYPLSDDQRAVVQAYRQALRDLPAQSGAPWDGGGEATPWPELPAGLKA